MESAGRSAIWTGRVFSLFAGLPFLFSGALKLLQLPQVTQGFEHLGWPPALILTLAVLEISSVVLYLIPPFSVLGAILLTGYLGGAIATHVRIGEPVYVHIVLGILIWGGLFLREVRLRVLLPVRGSDCVVKREITINRSPEAVFAYLKLLKNFQNWNPFLKKDPQARVEFRGTDGQPGFITAWNGNKEMGSGEQEITKIVEGQRVEFELRFLKPFQATNSAQFAVEPVGSGHTKVSWHMHGKSVFPMSLFSLFLNMDKIVGREFEAGLVKLKSVLEK